MQAGRLGNVDVWWLSGEIAKEPPAIRALAEMDQLLFGTDHLKLQPTKVRVALGKGEPYPLWLYQVEQARDECLGGGKDGTKLSMLVEFAEPILVKEIAAEQFQSQSSDEVIVEETRRYLPPAPSIARESSASPLR